MGVYRFEDLRVWQAAKRQADLVADLLRRPTFRRDRPLSEHMNAAALSVMFNIAEGFLRRRDGETLNFLRYSMASNGELKSGFYAAETRKFLSSEEFTELIALNDSIARMLRRWMATLTPSARRRPARSSLRRPETKCGNELPTKQGRTKDPGRTKDEGPRTKD